MKIMSFNVLCAGKGKNHWCLRQRLVKEIIKKYNPDVFGLQESHYGWMKYISKAFSGVYSYVGVGKDDGIVKGEFSPVFYDTNKYELLNKGDFWLSETPEKAGLGWDAVENRICSYAVLRDKVNDVVTVCFNTHLDHIGTTAMLESAKLIVKKAKEFSDSRIVITGDFNVTPDSDVYKLFMDNGFKDSRAVADSADSINSFHGYSGKSKMIDFILIKNIEKVFSVETVTDKINGQYPSDHFPVLADVE